ncbi:MAG TPA: hypothetical protein VGD67_26720, partial [Pseudonocardiaceae bacterium]
MDEPSARRARHANTETSVTVAELLARSTPPSSDDSPGSYDDPTLPGHAPADPAARRPTAHGVVNGTGSPGAAAQGTAVPGATARGAG